MGLIEWSTVLEDIISGGAVALAAGMCGWFFINKYTSNIRFSQKMRSYGFDQVSLKKQTKREVLEMCHRAEKIKMIYVSGSTYFSIYRKALLKALKDGVEIDVLCAAVSGPFQPDIERLERATMFNGEPVRKPGKFISDEISQLIKDYQGTGMKLRFYSTEYRLPYVIAYYKDGSVHAWLTMTLPPYRSKYSFMLRGKRDNKEVLEQKELDFIEMMENNFDAIWEFASESPKGALYEKWMNKYCAAKENMGLREGRKGALIEIAAQHPLIEGKYPNEEFEQRLLLGKELYDKLTAQGELVMIYVPGSRHKEGDKADEISLSEAGCRFLEKQGVPRKHLYGERENIRYRKEAGVYNSSDECYVASQLFKDHKFSYLYCVCSSAQMMRKAISYIQFECLPHFHTVTTDEMYHNYIDELFRNIPIVLWDDEALQGTSAEADRLRRERKC